MARVMRVTLDGGAIWPFWREPSESSQVPRLWSAWAHRRGRGPQLTITTNNETLIADLPLTPTVGGRITHCNGNDALQVQTQQFQVTSAMSSRALAGAQVQHSLARPRSSHWSLNNGKSGPTSSVGGRSCFEKDWVTSTLQTPLKQP